MNKLLFGIIMGAFFMHPVMPVEAATQPKAVCGDAAFSIHNLPQDERKVAIRINDKANDWNLEKPLTGDFANIITPRGSKFSFKATNGHTYSWWVHIENPDGTYGKAIGGETYCGAATPSSFTASCKDKEISLNWKKESSADHYAIRIDDSQNSWDEKDVLPGDTVENSVKEPKYKTEAQSGHGYNIWIHAVDKYGIFSAATEKFVSCKAGTQQVGIINSIRNFFTGFFS
jgi:hypothetical protein